MRAAIVISLEELIDIAQKLILPINKAKLTASWKTTAYKNKFGYVHYGCDIVSTLYQRTVYASGDGVVVGCGLDNVVGNVVAVKYTGAVNHVSDKVQDIVIRYFHLASISVKPGQKVNKDVVLGQYGNTGMLVMSPHLHIEADTDTGYPLYSPTVYSSNYLKGRAVGANDLTMTSPVQWLYTKNSGPDFQTWTTAGDAYIRAEDKTIPVTKD